MKNGTLLHLVAVMVLLVSIGCLAVGCIALHDCKRINKLEQEVQNLKRNTR